MAAKDYLPQFLKENQLFCLLCDMIDMMLVESPLTRELVFKLDEELFPERTKDDIYAINAYYMNQIYPFIGTRSSVDMILNLINLPISKKEYLIEWFESKYFNYEANWKSSVNKFKQLPSGVLGDTRIVFENESAYVRKAITGSPTAIVSVSDLKDLPTTKSIPVETDDVVHIVVDDTYYRYTGSTWVLILKSEVTSIIMRVNRVSDLPTTKEIPLITDDIVFVSNENAYYRYKMDTIPKWKLVAGEGWTNIANIELNSVSDLVSYTGTANEIVFVKSNKTYYKCTSNTEPYLKWERLWYGGTLIPFKFSLVSNLDSYWAATPDVVSTTEPTREYGHSWYNPSTKVLQFWDSVTSDWKTNPNVTLDEGRLFLAHAGKVVPWHNDRQFLHSYVIPLASKLMSLLFEYKNERSWPWYWFIGRGICQGPNIRIGMRSQNNTILGPNANIIRVAVGPATQYGNYTVIAPKFPKQIWINSTMIARNRITIFDKSLIESNSFPILRFDATPISGVAPLTVNFTANTERVNNWTWFTSDGQFSTEQNPTFVFKDVNKKYDITLRSKVDGIPTTFELHKTAFIETTTDLKPMVDISARIPVGISPLSVLLKGEVLGHYTNLEWIINGRRSNKKELVASFDKNTNDISLKVNYPGGSVTKTYDKIKIINNWNQPQIVPSVNGHPRLKFYNACILSDLTGFIDKDINIDLRYIPAHFFLPTSTLPEFQSILMDVFYDPTCYESFSIETPDYSTLPKYGKSLIEESPIVGVKRLTISGGKGVILPESDLLLITSKINESKINSYTRVYLSAMGIDGNGYKYNIAGFELVIKIG